MTNTRELRKVMAKIPPQDGSRFGGVYAADELPDPADLFRRIGGDEIRIIVNYDSANEPGSHWCAMSLISGARCDARRAVWFDSFGTPPDADDRILQLQDPGHPHTTHFHEYLLRFVGGRKDRISWNRSRMQALGSDVCGEYCVLFCRYGLPSKKTRPWRHIQSLRSALSRDTNVRAMAGVRTAY